MQYTKLKFSYEKFSEQQVSSLNGYIKNRIYTTSGDHKMYVDTQRLEIGKEKFKKELLKHYNNILVKINEQI